MLGRPYQQGWASHSESKGGLSYHYFLELERYTHLTSCQWNGQRPPKCTHYLLPKTEIWVILGHRCAAMAGVRRRRLGGVTPEPSPGHGLITEMLQRCLGSSLPGSTREDPQVGGQTQEWCACLLYTQRRPEKGAPSDWQGSTTS